MKVLNLDALAPAQRTLTLGGETYAVEEMTVENFIATTNAAEALEEKGRVTFADQIEATIAMIARSVPELPAEKLRRLTLEQLTTISKFLRGELDDKTTAVEGAEGEQKKEVTQ